MKTTRRTIRLSPHRSSRFGRGGRFTTSRQPSPRRALWLLLLPLLAAAVVVALIAHQRTEPLSSLVLVGDRSPACVRTVVLRDQSGSMAGYELAREAAMQQIVRWGSGEDTLRSNDELAIIDFAAQGSVALPTTTVEKASTSIPGNAVTDLGGSTIGSGILAMSALPSTDCVTSLVVLSDSHVTSLTSAEKEELVRQGVAHIALILPGDMGVGSEWSKDFPTSLVLRASAADPGLTAIAVGEAIAASVDQRLERRR